MYKIYSALAALVVMTGFASAANAVTAADTWATGVTGDYNTPGDWSAGVPTFPTTVQVGIDGPGSNVTYTGTSGDVNINSTFTVSNSATFTQNTSNGAYFHVGSGGGNSGTLNVQSSAIVDLSNAGAVFDGDGGTGNFSINGGTLITRYLTVNAGSSLSVTSGGTLTGAGGIGSIVGTTGVHIALTGGVGSVASFSSSGGTTTFDNNNFATNTNSQITITGGTVQSDVAATPDGTGSNGTFAPQGTFSISNGTLDVAAQEFKPGADGATLTVSGGLVKANLIGFENTGGMNFSGGQIDIFRGSSTAQSDHYALFTAGGTAGYLNFTADSTGVIDLMHSSIDNINAQGYLTNGAVRYDGAIDADAFSLTSDGGTGTLIQLKPSAVPEPASLALLGLGAALLLRKRR